MYLEFKLKIKFINTLLSIRINFIWEKLNVWKFTVKLFSMKQLIRCKFQLVTGLKYMYKKYVYFQFL